MPMMNCPDCNKEMSDSAPACPNCGRPNSNAASEKRPVSALLGVGIFFIPLIFSWFTLRKGHSVLARVLSLSWLVLYIAIIGGSDGTENRVASTSSSASNSPKTKSAQTETQHDTSKQKMPQAGKEIKVDVSIQLERRTDGRAHILGTTNLPDGMILMVSLHNVDGYTFVDTKAEVDNGRFSAVGFIRGGKATPSGEYKVRISSPYPALQSAAVRAVIGQKGENLSGQVETLTGPTPRFVGSKMVDITVKKNIP